MNILNKHLVVSFLKTGELLNPYFISTYGTFPIAKTENIWRETKIPAIQERQMSSSFDGRLQSSIF